MRKALWLIFALLSIGPVHAKEIDALSEISAVTVFPDRADISRTAELTLPAGKHTVVFNGLPAGLITESLRVAGKGSAGFTIGSVETKQIFTTELTAEEEKNIQAQIDALRDQRRFIEAQIKAANTGKAFLESLTKSPSLPVERTDAGIQTLPPQTWKEAWHTIQNGMNELGKEAIEKQIKLRSIDTETTALNNRLRIIATGKKGYKQIRINIESDKTVQARLTLQYQIMGASWQPLYEARLNSADQTVNIVQYGNITQKTGEDWTNVSLTLSTAQPSVTMQPPVLQPIWLNLRNKEPVMQYKGVRASPPMMAASITNFAVKEDMAMDAGALAEADEIGFELSDASFGATDAVGTEFSGVFAIKGDSNVPSDGSEYRFNIGDYASKAEIRAEIFPKIDASAYLIATLVFNGQLPLLPGRISLFRDGAFIGNSYMEMLRPNEKLHLAFGQDEKIRVAYTALGGETSEGGVIARETRKDSLSRTDVQNLHKQPLKIAVYEQKPVSRNSDVTVKIIKDKTTPGYIVEPNSKVGLIQWENIYQPQEKKEILYGYSISWPKDRILTGL
ncbi:MAG: mucoidy inhibitor MuiA family protein [Alphaproteobacteria bacterium]|nr:mucoidy inhibitor MuiA family protein [Alphaproteobacteria bacterium]